MLVNIEINGKKLQAENGKMLIEVTDEAGIHIPRFCYHKNLSISANCRMCLVEIEKTPKPMPACSTPVTEGMKIFTRSHKALAAQKAVMEFLLINHPLDCPVCDQGGECDLQDISIGFGDGVSQYVEAKRVVKDKNLGPLIATDMTRCIHCTRCVRFGKEIAGLREMGMVGRGDSSEISTYIEKSIDSELSGNIIDVCPVGALTSKPFRFQARSWEMEKHNSIALHDCVGSNIEYHTLRGEIKRVVARENQDINDTWISDRDRFSYLGLNHSDRLLEPMVKKDGKWEEASWEDALYAATNMFKKSSNSDGESEVAAIVSPSSSIEELFLAQKVIRGLGSNNIDHRLRQTDFRQQNNDPLYPGLGMPIKELSKQNAFLLVASNTRKEQPIIAHHIRQAVIAKGRKANAKVASISTTSQSTIYPLDTAITTQAQNIQNELLAIAKVIISDFSANPEPGMAELLSSVQVNDEHKKIANALKNAEKSVVLLGSMAQTLPDYSELRVIASFVAEHTSSTLSLLTAGANTSGAYIAGAVPHRTAVNASKTNGLSVQDMFNKPCSTYLLHGIEAERDLENPHKALSVLKAAQVVVMTPYVTDVMKDYADVLLPTSSYTESSGTYINIAGNWQSVQAVSEAKGRARPAWKILRVLGNLLDISEMDYLSSEEVKNELAAMYASATSETKISWTCPGKVSSQASTTTHRLSEQPIYSVDSVVRRATALQQTVDGEIQELVRINPQMASQKGVTDGDKITLSQGDASCESEVKIDAAIPDNCVYISLGTIVASKMSSSFSEIKLTK